MAGADRTSSALLFDEPYLVVDVYITWPRHQDATGIDWNTLFPQDVSIEAIIDAVEIASVVPDATMGVPDAREHIVAVAAAHPMIPPAGKLWVASLSWKPSLVSRLWTSATCQVLLGGPARRFSSMLIES